MNYREEVVHIARTIPPLDENRYYETADYKFNEDELLDQIRKYIDSTYEQHYAKSKFQATEFIIDNGHGIGFMVGNIMKYAQRYGKKGGRADWRKDLMKVIHYAIIALHVHDEENEEAV